MAKLKDLKNEIKALDVAALINRAKALKIEISELTLDRNINRIKDLKSVSKKRKELARVLTVMNQKKLISTLETSDKNQEPGEKTKAKKEKKGEE